MDARRAELAQIVEAMPGDGPAELRFTLPPRSPRRRLGVLPGSFNPPTSAHVALARAGRAAGLDVVAYLLGKRTVNKEQVTGIRLADRLRLLEEIAAPVGDAVVFGNAGLYVDQADALRRLCPEAAEVVFLVGFDKIVQIFDPRYYDDRDAALDRLFAAASFLVAPRGDADADDLRALLAAPGNRRYASGVVPLPLESRYRQASSTRVRDGEAEDVPKAVAAFIARWRPFDPNGPYSRSFE